jgi:hypothetical protein
MVATTVKLALAFWLHADAVHDHLAVAGIGAGGSRAGCD